MTYDVDYYLSEISNRSDRYGDKLGKLLEETNNYRLIDITLEQAKSFYEKLVANENEK